MIAHQTTGDESNRDAERLCDRFGLLHRGRLVSEGTLAQLRAETGCEGLVDMFFKLARTGPALRRAPRSRDEAATDGRAEERA